MISSNRILVILSLITNVFSSSDTESKKSLNMKFEKYVGDSNFEQATKNARPYINADLTKRGEVGYTLTNKNTFYSVSLGVGTPSQSLSVLLDTGSSDLWVIENCSSNSCSQYGTFQHGKSSTFHNNGTTFYVTYGDSTYGSGSWGFDELSINGAAVGKLSFGVANQTDTRIAVLGLGLPGLETTYSGPKATKPYQYSNLPMVLKQNGAIDATMFSLFLNNLTASSGNVLFGAVDTGKFTGGLYTLPMISTYSSSGYATPVTYEVTLQGLGVSSDSSKTTISTTKFAALLDSGSTLMMVPSSLMTLIASSLGATYDSSAGYYSISCDSINQDFVFDFGGFHINSPINNYVISSSSGKCYLGIVGSTAQFIVLGDVFLTSAYVVFDLDHYEISLAQVDYYGKSNVQEVGSYIPSAVKAAGYSSTWTTFQSAATGGNIFTLSSSTSVSSSSSSSSSPSSSSSRASSSTFSSTSSSASSTKSSSSSKSSASSSSSGTAQPFVFTLSQPMTVTVSTEVSSIQATATAAATAIVVVTESNSDLAMSEASSIAASSASAMANSLALSEATSLIMQKIGSYSSVSSSQIFYTTSIVMNSSNGSYAGSDSFNSSTNSTQESITTDIAFSPNGNATYTQQSSTFGSSTSTKKKSKNGGVVMTSNYLSWTTLLVFIFELFI